MSNLEPLLRDEFGHVADEVPPLRSCDMIASIRRKHARRGIATKAGAGVAVLAVVAISVTALHVFGTATSPLHRPSPTDAGPPLSDAQWNKALESPNSSPVPMGGRFVDSSHGAIVIQRCSRPNGQDECTSSIQVTDDGGKTFTARRWPASPDGILYVFSATDLVVDDQAQYTPSPVSRRYVSHDDGAHWQTVPANSSGTRATIPAAAQLFSDLHRVGGGRETSPVFALTSSGRSYEITGVPTEGLNTLAGVRGANMPFVVEQGGSYFLAESRPQNGVDLWVTHDNGASWQKSTVTTATNLTMLGFSGGRFFARNPTASDGVGLLASSDGVNWNPVRAPALTTKPCPEISFQEFSFDATPSTAGTSRACYVANELAVSPNGVLASDSVNAWRLGSTAQTFARITKTLTTYDMTGFGAMASGDAAYNGALAIYFTADGTHWQRATFDTP